MKERKGWTRGRSCRMLLDNGWPPSFVLSELSCREAAFAIKYTLGSGWHFPIHLCLFLSSISHPLSQLIKLSFTLLPFHFLESESMHYGLNSAIFPQMHLEALGSVTVGAMLFRRRYNLELSVPKHSSSLHPEVLLRHSLSFCSFPFYKNANLPSFSSLTRVEGG